MGRIEPRAPAGLAASALGCPARRFQRSNSLVDTLSTQLLHATRHPQVLAIKQAVDHRRDKSFENEKALRALTGEIPFVAAMPVG